MGTAIERLFRRGKSARTGRDFHCHQTVQQHQNQKRPPMWEPRQRLVRKTRTHQQLMMTVYKGFRCIALSNVSVVYLWNCKSIYGVSMRFNPRGPWSLCCYYYCSCSDTSEVDLKTRDQQPISRSAGCIYRDSLTSSDINTAIM